MMASLNTISKYLAEKAKNPTPEDQREIEEMCARLDAECEKKFGPLEKLAATISAGVDAQQAEIERLRDLVRHCWVHSGHRDCGYDQMTTEQKALYRAVIGRTEPER